MLKYLADGANFRYIHKPGGRVVAANINRGQPFSKPREAETGFGINSAINFAESYGLICPFGSHKNMDSRGSDATAGELDVMF